MLLGRRVIRYRTADETSALLNRVRPTTFLLRAEGRVLIVLTVFACVSVLMLYKALFSS